MRDATIPTRHYALNLALTRGIQALLLFAFLLGMAPFATAQYRASIQGVVTDPSGAVVPGVALTLKNNSNNHTMTATSNDSGVYNFNALPPDTFTLTADAARIPDQDPRKPAHYSRAGERCKHQASAWNGLGECHSLGQRSSGARYRDGHGKLDHHQQSD